MKLALDEFLMIAAFDKCSVESGQSDDRQQLPFPQNRTRLLLNLRVQGDGKYESLLNFGFERKKELVGRSKHAR